MDGLKANLDDLDEDEAEKTSEKFKAATWYLFLSRNHTYFWRYCNH